MGTSTSSNTDVTKPPTWCYVHNHCSGNVWGNCFPIQTLADREAYLARQAAMGGAR